MLSNLSIYFRFPRACLRNYTMRALCRWVLHTFEFCTLLRGGRVGVQNPFIGKSQNYNEFMRIFNKLSVLVIIQNSSVVRSTSVLIKLGITIRQQHDRSLECTKINILLNVHSKAKSKLSII